MLYECHIIPIAIKNIVDAFLQNGQIIRILKSETPTATLCRVSCCYPITIVYKKGFFKNFFLTRQNKKDGLLPDDNCMTQK